MSRSAPHNPALTSVRSLRRALHDEGNMRLACVLLTAAAVALPFAHAKNSDADKKELEAWAHSLDKEAVHKAVLEHERNPLARDVKKNIRPVLAVHFEPLDYIVCLDQIGPLLHTKSEVHEAIFWQVVFASGDFVEQHPDRAKDKLAYMQAGLESGLRIYEHLLPKNPKVRLELLDRLLLLRNDGHLLEFVKEHPCDKE